MGIELHGERQLPGVAHAGDPLRLFLVPDEHWEEEGREDANDGDDHQQLNQRKCAFGRVDRTVCNPVTLVTHITHVTYLTRQLMQSPPPALE